MRACREAELATLTQQLTASSELTQQLQIIVRDSSNSTAAKDLQIAQLAEQLAVARQDWARLHSAKEAELDALQSQLLQHSASVEQLHCVVRDTSCSTAAKDAHIAELKESVGQLQLALRDSSNGSIKKDAQIAAVKEQLSVARQAWANLSDDKDMQRAESGSQLMASQEAVQQLQVVL